LSGVGSKRAKITMFAFSMQKNSFFQKLLDLCASERDYGPRKNLKNFFGWIKILKFHLKKIFLKKG
jgi:hypothetical protein